MDTHQVGCELWPGAVNRQGYGKTTHNGKTVGAHRVAYCAAKGIDITAIDGLLVLHSCDNPGCINPDHLRTGTAKHNAEDCTARDRWVKHRPEQRKLSHEEVISIRKAYTPSIGNKPNPTGYAGLARTYGVGPQAIKQIVNNQAYRF